MVFGDELQFCIGMHDGCTKAKQKRGEHRDIHFSVQRHMHQTYGSYGIRCFIGYETNSRCIPWIKWYNPIILNIVSNQQNNAHPNIGRVSPNRFEKHILIFSHRPLISRLLTNGRRVRHYKKMAEELNELTSPNTESSVASIAGCLGQLISREHSTTYWNQCHEDWKSGQLLGVARHSITKE